MWVGGQWRAVFLAKQRQRKEQKTVDELIMMTVTRRNVDRSCP